MMNVIAFSFRCRERPAPEKPRLFPFTPTSRQQRQRRAQRRRRSAQPEEREAVRSELLGRRPAEPELKPEQKIEGADFSVHVLPQVEMRAPPHFYGIAPRK